MLPDKSAANIEVAKIDDEFEQLHARNRQASLISEGIGLVLKKVGEDSNEWYPSTAATDRRVAVAIESDGTTKFVGVPPGEYDVYLRYIDRSKRSSVPRQSPQPLNFDGPIVLNIGDNGTTRVVLDPGLFPVKGL